MRFYAVKNGLSPGIYETWDECQKQVKGFSGAVFKSFKNKKEAEDYLYTNGNMVENIVKENKNKEDNCIHLYSDGSYNESTKEYGMGFVIVKDDKVLRICSSKNYTPDFIEHRNISGEVFAVVKGITDIASYLFNYNKVVIHHDYLGIAKWATGEWKATKELTKCYKESMDDFKKQGFNVTFEHVKGHTGNKYNELADKLAGYRIKMIKPSEAQEVEKLLKAISKNN